MVRKSRRHDDGADDTDSVVDAVVDAPVGADEPEDTSASRGDRPSLIHLLLERVPVLLTAYRVGVAVVGFSIVGFGILLLPLPGPGWVVIFAGVWVLAAEYPAAARVLAVMRRWAAAIVRFIERRRARRRRKVSRRTAKLEARADAESRAAAD